MNRGTARMLAVTQEAGSHAVLATIQRIFYVCNGSKTMQTMDSENPVVKLCVQGMECESKGNFEGASKLFLSAWGQSTNDFERCIAAHYVARHQSPEEALIWNQKSLDCAGAAGDERVSGFFPSLYLNMGKAYEDLGKRDHARQFYTMAMEALSILSDDEYGKVIRVAVERAVERIR